MIRSYPGEVMVRKCWKNTKSQFYSSSPIIYEFFNFWKIYQKKSRAYKSGLGWFGVSSVKLWSENVEKSRKDNFTVVLLLFMKIWIFEKFWDFFSESIKLDWGDSELFRRSYGRFTGKKTHTFTAIYLCSRIIYDSGPDFFFRSSKIRHTNFQIHPVFRTYLLVPKWCFKKGRGETFSRTQLFWDHIV